MLWDRFSLVNCQLYFQYRCTKQYASKEWSKKHETANTLYTLTQQDTTTTKNAYAKGSQAVWNKWAEINRYIDIEYSRERNMRKTTEKKAYNEPNRRKKEKQQLSRRPETHSATTAKWRRHTKAKRIILLIQTENSTTAGHWDRYM